jgi:hypothetical protein
MTAFEIRINGEKVCTAGLNEPGVVTSIVSWLRGVPKAKDAISSEHIDIRIGGLNSRTDTHLTWLTRTLQIGDEVKIKVLAKAKVDKPTRRKSSADMKALASKFRGKFKTMMSNQSSVPTLASGTSPARQEPRLR